MEQKQSDLYNEFLKESLKVLTRREARELALQFLFSWGDNQTTPAYEDFRSFCFNFNQPADSFSWALIEGTLDHLKSLNEKIVALSKHWRMERMPKVDLAILRLAAFEVEFCVDIPKSVTINEAVELAKKFGAEGSASFVNGILDKFEKAVLAETSEI